MSEVQKIVFVQPLTGFKGASYWDCLGVGYIISYIKASGFPGEIEFYSGAFDSDETIVEACSDADMVGFSCTSPQMKHALKLAGEIKGLNPKCRVVIGGWHATALPVETALHPNVDHVVVGEGEEGMLRLVNGETNDNIIYSEPVKNLDMLPWPDRETIKVERHIETAYRENGERITSVEASRGCAFRCSFCSEHLKTHGKVRRRTPKLVVDEIEYLANKYNLDLIKFVDAEINSSIAWLNNLCDELIERRIPVELGANFHAAFATRQLFQKMKKAGFREIWIGCESGSPRILKEVRKGVTVEQIKNVFKWSGEAGLIRRAYFMCGFPTETKEDVEQTFKLAEEIKADVYGMTILMPFPGTEIYNQFRDELNIMNWDFSVCDEYSNPYWFTVNFSNQDLKEIQQKFKEKFKDKLCYRLDRKRFY